MKDNYALVSLWIVGLLRSACVHAQSSSLEQQAPAEAERQRIRKQQQIEERQRQQASPAVRRDAPATLPESGIAVYPRRQSSFYAPVSKSPRDPLPVLGRCLGTTGIDAILTQHVLLAMSQQLLKNRLDGLTTTAIHLTTQHQDFHYQLEVK